MLLLFYACMSIILSQIDSKGFYGNLFKETAMKNALTIVVAVAVMGLILGCQPQETKIQADGKVMKCSCSACGKKIECRKTEDGKCQIKCPKCDKWMECKTDKDGQMEMVCPACGMTIKCTKNKDGTCSMKCPDCRKKMTCNPSGCPKDKKM